MKTVKINKEWYESGQIKKDGEKEWYESGQIKKDGEKEWYESGQIKTDGEKEWFENGQIKTDSLKNFFSRKEWYESGQIKTDGEKEWYESGQIKLGGDGLFPDKEWYESGKLKRDGYNEWFENGNKKIEHTTFFFGQVDKDGRISSPEDSIYKEWYETGELKIINSKNESKMWFKCGKIKSEGYISVEEQSLLSSKHFYVENGFWEKEWYENGQLKKDGKKEWYENGQLKKDGKKKWYENGLLKTNGKEETISENLKTETYLSFHENGNKEFHDITIKDLSTPKPEHEFTELFDVPGWDYFNRVKEENREWYKNGNLKRERINKDSLGEFGEKQSIYREWYQNGQIKFEDHSGQIKFENNNYTNIQTGPKTLDHIEKSINKSWYESGQLKKDGEKEWYESGQLKKDGEKEWYESGQLKKDYDIKTINYNDEKNSTIQYVEKSWNESNLMIFESVRRSEYIDYEESDSGCSGIVKYKDKIVSYYSNGKIKSHYESEGELLYGKYEEEEEEFYPELEEIDEPYYNQFQQPKCPRCDQPINEYYCYTCGYNGSDD